ncbi:MAG: phosphoribosylamine--glycine ligase [Elusimicrobiota bacterium]
MKKTVLLIGGGGREHALAWALKKSPEVTTLFCGPGNPGMAALGTCVPLELDHGALMSFVRHNTIDFTVVGPEAPLAAGVADWVRAEGGRVFGPGAAAARLESSKAFAKEFMKKHGIPTAEFEIFPSPQAAAAFVNSAQWKENMRVVKASGLAGGKGVIVCPDKAGVLSAVAIMEEFGDAGRQIVIEEILEGQEVSVMALCDGEALLPFPPSQDHKRVYDGDRGPNTGGMGAYAPAPLLTPELWKTIETKIFEPFLRGLAVEKLDYRGVIYFGLMLTAKGPVVLEFNVRFGDPETQAVLPLVQSYLMDLLEATEARRLKDVTLRVKDAASVCVAMASAGYPGAFNKGRVITGLDKPDFGPDVLVFHAGTMRGASNEPLRTAGGRVLGVTGLGSDLASARKKAYDAVEKIRFEGAHYRKDIASKALGS